MQPLEVVFPEGQESIFQNLFQPIIYNSLMLGFECFRTEFFDNFFPISTVHQRRKLHLLLTA